MFSFSVIFEEKQRCQLLFLAKSFMETKSFFSQKTNYLSLSDKTFTSTKT